MNDREDKTASGSVKASKKKTAKKKEEAGKAEINYAYLDGRMRFSLQVRCHANYTKMVHESLTETLAELQRGLPATEIELSNPA